MGTDEGDGRSPAFFRNALLIVATGLVCLLFASVSASGGVGLWGPPEWDPAPLAQSPVDIEITPVEIETSPPADESSSVELPKWLSVVLQVVLVGLAAALVVALLSAGWQRRPHVRWRRRRGSADFEALPDVAASVVAKAAEQRAALLDGAPRNAIVRCWLQLERDVAAAGLHRDPADTSLEFTERVLARYAVDPGAIGELAARYREARFSDHELGEADRQAALAALDRLHRTLAAGTDVDAAVGGAR